MIIWPGVCRKSPQLYAHHTVKIFVQLSYVAFAISSAYLRVHVRVCVCVIVCVCGCTCVCTHTCLIHAVPFRALQLWFLSLYITFFLSFCVCFSFSLPFSVLLFFSFLSIYWRCCSLLSQCPARLCDITAGSVQSDQLLVKGVNETLVAQRVVPALITLSSDPEM